jgi:hypothetical protein
VKRRGGVPGWWAKKFAKKPNGLVILSEAKDLALSFSASAPSRFTTGYESAAPKRTTNEPPYRVDKAQSEVLRFAQDDSVAVFSAT